MNRRLNIGEQIGEYRITQFLGAGGMGEVYRGEHLKLGRAAAIKVLLSSVTDASFTQRFMNEARLQANLHHPHIAALYDFQEIGGQLCIFMEYVDGTNLEDVVKARSLAVEDALEIFAAIVEAVGFIHLHGIVHRDIKSQNVKLTSNGKPKLLDFGIAKDSTDNHGLTQTGGVIGTPHYLAPEQLDGKPASRQTDIWALGVLLYEMLTGDLPFQGETLAGLVLKITIAQFSAPEKLNPAVPREVSRIVGKCLEKDCARRYQTTDEILQDVRNYLSDRSHSKTFGFLTDKTANGFFGSKQTAAQNGAADLSFPQNDFAVNENSENQTPKKNSRLALFAGAAAFAVILLFASIGVLIFFMRGESKSVANSNVNKPSNNTLAVVVPKGAERQIKIDVDEGKAQVFRGAEPLGQTPLDLIVKDGEKVELTLKRDGYEEKTVQFEASGGKKVYTFSLKQK